MISFNLRCPLDHEFEGWFQSSADYDDQKASARVTCPICGSTEIEKALMAPNVATRGAVQAVSTKVELANKAGAAMFEMAKKIRGHVEENFENVGADFADEARRIHEGKSDERGIYGEATSEEVKGLVEDGVDVMPLPDVPSADDKKKLN